MLENEFFPTPASVIKRMLQPYFTEGYRYSRKYLRGLNAPYCDPNGGSGAILDYLTNEIEIRKSQLFACEINPELRYVLQGKGYKVVGTDFLEYSEPIRYGTMIMNPPFSEGARHVLKAWQVLDDGGSLIALLNAETLKNPCTKEREILLHLLASQLEEAPEYDLDDPASVTELLRKLEEGDKQEEDEDEEEETSSRYAVTKPQILEWFGSCFKNAERPTDVEVVCIRLKKPKAQPASYSFADLGMETDEQAHADGNQPSDEAWATNPLALRDALKDLVCRYEAARKLVLARHEAQKMLDFYMTGLSSPYYGDIDRKEQESLSQSTGVYEQLTVLKARAWSTVFDKTKLGSRTTSDFQKKFATFAQTQSAMAFTETNVREVLEMFFLNREQIMEDAILHTFDEATAYHEKNKIHIEGWKTNKAWKCNKRIIIPYGVDSSYGMFRPYDRVRDFLNDLDKIMCFLSGQSIENTRSSYAALYDFLRGCDGDYQHPIDSTFFKMRGFRKGTLHIDFKDLDLLAKFNSAAAKGKQWLGDGS